MRKISVINVRTAFCSMTYVWYAGSMTYVRYAALNNENSVRTGNSLA